ncbi:hypothetical protein BUALT_BualtUnG0018900 [Buddleja alternifolia]|uniref:Uncharacterized protein n=1 Tax=Buddleja alternifolia TaxID=168488 RepID=A0AAV6W0J6_9LAMI|nr:hypothetical protein BUALT_BualtUnG0018900 [Buddleja alternifolia]
MADDTNFPRLEYLVLACLDKLKEVPSGMGDIPTLRSIELTYCGNSVVISAKKIVDEQKELGNLDLQVNVIAWEKDELLESLENRIRNQQSAMEPSAPLPLKGIVTDESPVKCSLDSKVGKTEIGDCLVEHQVMMSNLKSMNAAEINSEIDLMNVEDSLCVVALHSCTEVFYGALHLTCASGLNSYWRWTEFFGGGLGQAFPTLRSALLGEFWPF